MSDSLIRHPNIADPDGFYAALIAAQQGLSDEEAELLLAKLVLILANQVGDAQLLQQALTLARANTLAARKE